MSEGGRSSSSSGSGSSGSSSLSPDQTPDQAPEQTPDQTRPVQSSPVPGPVQAAAAAAAAAARRVLRNRTRTAGCLSGFPTVIQWTLKATGDTKKKPLKDNSWIRRDVEEDEPVDRDPNFGKTILGRYSSKETLNSPEPEETSIPKLRTSSTSVQALTKRFSMSQEELNDISTLPSNYGQKTTSYTRSLSSSLKSDDPMTTTTTSVSKDGTTTETTITTRQVVSSSPVSKTPTKTDAFTERVFSDVKSSSKGELYSPLSPSKTTKVTETTFSTKNLAEDKLFDTLLSDDRSTSVTETVTLRSSTDSVEDDLYDSLLPKSLQSGPSTPVSTAGVIKSSVFTVESPKGDDSKTTTTTTITTTRNSSTTEDDLYDTLLPKSMKSDLPSSLSSTSFTKREVLENKSSYNSTDDTPSTRTTSYTISSEPSDGYISTRRSYSSRPDSSYEYSSITSPTVYTTTSYKDSSAHDLPANDAYLSKSSIKTLYSSSERLLLEKDLCSYCHKPFNSEAKMVLEDMKINCHASCFKCEVCSNTLGHMKAGDSMWIYKRAVHCESCFDLTREKWRR